MSLHNEVVENDFQIAKRPKSISAKQQKTHQNRHRGSRIFAPYRTLGLVSSTEVPFTAIPLGKTTFQITTSIGTSLHTYDLRKGLQLNFVTRPQTPAKITACYAWKERVFAAWGGAAKRASSSCGVWVFKRGKRIAELEKPLGFDEPVRQLLIFGSWIVGCCYSRIEIWKSRTYEHYTTLTPVSSHGGSRDGASLSGPICNLPTLLNKVLAGKHDGSLELWNVATGKLVYTISPPSVDSGAVTALQPSPALSLVAIARADGSIIIHDIRLDKEVIRLSSTLQGSSSITSIIFRTDGLGAGEDGRKAGVLATASSQSGDVILWDLNKGGRMTGILRNAHDPPSSMLGQSSGGITKIEFLPGQPVLVSTGSDNSLKTWIFDESPFSPIPRILHRRGGHAAPVTKLSFLPTESEGADAIGKWLLSASRDQSLWGWSLRRDNQSTELSQGNIRAKAKKLGITSKALSANQDTTLEDLKAPEITCMACSLNRDGGMGASTGGGLVWANVTSHKIAEKNSENGSSGWESVVTGHKGDNRARTWFWGRKKAGRWALETGDGAEVKSVAVTLCGTFALVGSAAGGIDMYNLQSGIHRKRFPAPVSPAQARKLRLRQLEEEESGVSASRDKFGPGEGRHTRAVTSINVDSLNRVVISSGLDGRIKFWNFHTGVLQHDIDWHPMSSITGSRYHRPNDLLALSCDDLSIRVVDIETKKLVREFWGCVGSINDFCFSNDGRWIIAASMDSVVRVWDLPTGHLIDAFRLPSPCTSLAISPTGEFLATSHPDTVGINIWTNRTLFTHVPTRHVPDGEVRSAELPSASGEGNEGLLDAAFEEDSVSEESDIPIDPLPASTTSPDQLSSDLMTLSLVPRARWQTLLHLDTISQRNKPIEPPKAPQKAPFFLPSSLALSSNPNLSDLGTTSANQLSASSEPVIPPAERSRILLLQKSRNASKSQFTTLLHQSAQTQDASSFVAHLASLSPSAADIEIRSLSPMPIPKVDPNVPTANEMTLFVRALTQRLSQKRDFELVQAWMAVFLRLHGEVIVHAPEEVEGDGVRQGGEDEEQGRAARGLRKELRLWREVMQGETKRLGEIVDYCVGVIGFLRSGR